MMTVAMDNSVEDDDVVTVTPANAAATELNNDIECDEDDVDSPSLRVLNSLEQEPFATKFDRHEGAVFAVACHADLVVSGGEDDKGFLWHTETGNVIAEFSGFEDSVSHVGFNSNGSLLFVADLAGHVQFYKISSMFDVEKCFETDVDGELRCAEWHHAAGSNVFLCGTASGQCWIYRIPQGECKVFQTPVAVTCFVQVGADGKKLMLGVETGAVYFLDLKSMTSDFDIQPPGGASARRGNDAETADQNVEITCIASTSDGSVCAMGTADGEVKLVSIAKKQVVWSIRDLHWIDQTQPQQPAAAAAGAKTNEENADVSMQDDSAASAAAAAAAAESLSIEAVQFGNQQTSAQSPWLAVASMRGVVCIFDVKSRTRRHILELKNIAFTQMLWPRRDNWNNHLLFLGDVDGHVVTMDSRTAELKKRFMGPEGTILSLTFSENSKWLAAASDDGNVYTYRMQV